MIWHGKEIATVGRMINFVKYVEQEGAMDRNIMDRQERSVVISDEQIAAYVKHLGEANYGKATIERYRYNLEDFFNALPEDKRLNRSTLAVWRERLLKEGLAPRTVNLRINVANGFLNYLDLREFQLTGGLAFEDDELLPELTRWEYQRLLQTAKALEKEWLYLLVKVFALTGLPVQCMDKLTVAVVKRGRFTVEHKMGKRQIRLPRSLQRELLNYAGRKVSGGGPIFITRTGKPLRRSYVNAELRRLCGEAKVPEEKGNPRCLRRLYFKTQQEIEENVRAQVEQSYDRMLEREQLNIGWDA